MLEAAGRPTPSVLRHLLASEAAGGILLILAAILAMIAANSPMASVYHEILHAETGPVLSPKLGPMTIHLWINDGLMAIFFLFVGLEIKREFVDGRLSTWERRRLPVVAAAAGMIVPALIYMFVARGLPELRNGWAIPAATDIAFAIGVLALLGRRAPTSLKLFLLTVAIVDDLGAVAIIALAYTEQIDSRSLGGAAAILFILYTLGKSGMTRLWIYLVGGALVWVLVLRSGVHATVAGVLVAATIPLIRSSGRPDDSASPLHRLEHGLAPWVAFGIVPLFGFANAGLSLDGLDLSDLLAPLPLGIAAGLFIGKQIGIFGAVWLSVRLGLASRMRGTTWLQVYGISVLCGIGFTMSLFIDTLAFPGNLQLVDEAKLGILFGSLLSALTGFLVLRLAPPAPDQQREEELVSREIDSGGDVEGGYPDRRPSE